MKPIALPRWALWLAGGLSAAGVLVAFAGVEPGADGAAKPARDASTHRAAPAAAAPMRRDAKAGAAEPGRVELERLSLARPLADDRVGNVFDATSWYVPPPPPPPPPPQPPPQPTAPPLPFAYLGTYTDVAAPVLILSKGGRVYTVSSGDVIDGIYRVGNMVGNSVELIYLPLNITQTLGTGGA